MLQFDRTRLFPAVSLYLTFQSGINRLISTLGQKEIYDQWQMPGNMSLL